MITATFMKNGEPRIGEFDISDKTVMSIVRNEHKKGSVSHFEITKFEHEYEKAVFNMYLVQE